MKKALDRSKIDASYLKETTEAISKVSQAEAVLAKSADFSQNIKCGTQNVRDKVYKFLEIPHDHDLRMMRLLAAAALCLHATALTTPQPRVGKVAKVTAPPSAAVDVSRPAATLAALATATTPLASYAAAPAWVEPVSNVLDPCFFIIQFIMLLRVIISWFPETDVNEMPWVLVCAPTEGLLKITRDIVPPSFGVDISPVVWIAVASFLREILLGQQGILVLMAQGRM